MRQSNGRGGSRACCAASGDSASRSFVHGDPEGAFRFSRSISGRSTRYTARPASDSPTSRRSRRLAEPVRRKRPRRRSASTARLIATSKSGARCTSSTVIGSGASTSASGSRRAWSSVVSESSVRNRRDAAAGTERTSVVFPTWRAPVTTTTGKRRRRSRRAGSRRRGYRRVGSPMLWAFITRRPGDQETPPPGAPRSSVTSAAARTTARSRWIRRCVSCTVFLPLHAVRLVGGAVHRTAGPGV